MKRFVRNDNRLYNMTKWRFTFLCIMAVVEKSQKYRKKTHFFVQNDNCRKSQKHHEKVYFFVHNDGLQKVTKLLRKGYKSYKIVISISPSPLGGYPPDTCGCMPSVVPCARVYVQRSCVW